MYLSSCQQHPMICPILTELWPSHVVFVFCVYLYFVFDLKNCASSIFLIQASSTGWFVPFWQISGQARRLRSLIHFYQAGTAEPVSIVIGAPTIFHHHHSPPRSPHHSCCCHHHHCQHCDHYYEIVNCQVCCDDVQNWQKIWWSWERRNWWWYWSNWRSARKSSATLRFSFIAPLSGCDNNANSSKQRSDKEREKILLPWRPIASCSLKQEESQQWYRRVQPW